MLSSVQANSYHLAKLNKMKVKNIIPDMLVNFIESNSLEFKKKNVYEIAKKYVYSKYKKPSKKQVDGLRYKLEKNYEKISNLLNMRSLSEGVEHETTEEENIDATEQTETENAVEEKFEVTNESQTENAVVTQIEATKETQTDTTDEVYRKIEGIPETFEITVKNSQA